jgi:saccharopine dehydrogenase-like NADP-dependent oxidoreductase
VHSEKRTYDFPVVGKQSIYLTGHDELHSLSKNINANSIRFWMGFSDHYITCFNVLKNIGLLSIEKITTDDGQTVVPLKVVKACLPDPKSLAPDYVGKTCIGCLVKGKLKRKDVEVFIYNVCDHKAAYEEVESQAISYTAGVPPVAAAILVVKGIWDPKTMVNVEELDPVPFIEQLDQMGLPTDILHIKRGRAELKKGEQKNELNSTTTK